MTWIKHRLPFGHRVAPAAAWPRAWPAPLGAVTNEDKAIPEECDWDVPLDLKSGDEFHMASDRPGLLMRQRLRALLLQQGEAEMRRPAAASSTRMLAGR